MFGMALGRTLASESFLTDIKPRVAEMLRDIRKAFEHSVISEQRWMDTSTREATADKSRRMKQHIGFPEWLLIDDKLEEYYKGVTIYINGVFNI